MTKEDREFFESKLGDLSGGFGLDYNLFACEQGILIADALQSKEKIKEFYEMGWDEQKKLVPGLDDGHTGNTFSMSCRIALAYLPITEAKIRDGKINQILED